MSAIQPDQSWLNDTVTVERFLGEGDYNKPTYDKAITLAPVRVDLTKDFTGVGANRTIVANATVFLFAAYTAGYPGAIDDSWLQARLMFNGHPYKVVDWSSHEEPDSSAPFSIELKVI